MLLTAVESDIISSLRYIGTDHLGLLPRSLLARDIMFNVCLMTKRARRIINFVYVNAYQILRANE